MAFTSKKIRWRVPPIVRCICLPLFEKVLQNFTSCTLSPAVLWWNGVVWRIAQLSGTFVFSFIPQLSTTFVSQCLSQHLLSSLDHFVFFFTHVKSLESFESFLSCPLHVSSNISWKVPRTSVTLVSQFHWCI